MFREKSEEVAAVRESVGDDMAGDRRRRPNVRCEEEEFVGNIFLRDDTEEGWEEGLVRVVWEEAEECCGGVLFLDSGISLVG